MTKEDMTYTEVLVDLRDQLRTMDAKLDEHLIAAAAERTLLLELNRNHHALDKDYRGADGNNGFKGATQKDISSIKTSNRNFKWTVGLLVACYGALSATGVI